MHIDAATVGRDIGSGGIRAIVRVTSGRTIIRLACNRCGVYLGLGGLSLRGLSRQRLGLRPFLLFVCSIDAIRVSLVITEPGAN